MLNKFENGEAVLSDDDPRRKLEGAWNDFFTQFKSNRKLIMECGGKRTESAMFDDLPNYGEEHFEAELYSKAPELAQSMEALRRALDSIVGWRITWRHPEAKRQWETIDVPSNDIPGVLVPETIRLPLQYYHNEGWIKGSIVGPDPIMVGPLAVRIEITDSMDSTRGIYIGFDEMLHIELTPP